MSKLIEDRKLRDKVNVFRDRFYGGKVLARLLNKIDIKLDVVIAIPAGGIPVGIEVARHFNIDLKVAIVRKILFPWTSEAGFGAVSWTNKIFYKNPGLNKEELEKCIENALKSVEKRMKLFKKYLPSKIENKNIVLVDDGLATGYTMYVAVDSIKDMGVKNIVVGAPTSSIHAINILLDKVDYIVVPNIRTSPIFAVADAYTYWRDLTEIEVLNILEKYG